MKLFQVAFSLFALLLLVGVGCLPASNPQQGAEDSMDSMMEDKDDAMMEDDGAMMEKDAMSEDGSGAMMENEGSAMMEKNDEAMVGDENSMMEEKAMDDSATQAGSYEQYSEGKLAAANSGDVVLFFHASWCPKCRALDSNINENLGNIPQGLTILKTDYDSQTQLRQQYGVTYQHTFVQVDAEGNMIKKWSGSSTLSELAANVE